MLSVPFGLGSSFEPNVPSTCPQGVAVQGRAESELTYQAGTHAVRVSDVG